METTKDIIAEMRIRCVDKNHSPELWEYLDRIEKAVTNCNQLKMREALNRIHMLLWDYLREKILVESLCRIIEKEIDTALSAPPRNCDLYTDYGDAVRAFDDDEDAESYEDMGEWLFEEAKGGK